jgi:hypothetical protein
LVTNNDRYRKKTTASAPAVLKNSIGNGRTEHQKNG